MFPACLWLRRHKWAVDALSSLVVRKRAVFAASHKLANTFSLSYESKSCKQKVLGSTMGLSQQNVPCRWRA